MWINLSATEIEMLRDALHGYKHATTAHTMRAVALATKLTDDMMDRMDRSHRALVAKAVDLHQREGTVEVDEQSDGSALVSIGEDGAYVLAWVYVPNDPNEELDA